MRNRIDDNQLAESFDGDQENFVALIGEDGLPAERLACLEQNQADHDACWHHETMCETQPKLLPAGKIMFNSRVRKKLLIRISSEEKTMARVVPLPTPAAPCEAVKP